MLGLHAQLGSPPAYGLIEAGRTAHGEYLITGRQIQRRVEEQQTAISAVGTSTKGRK